MSDSNAFQVYLAAVAALRQHFAGLGEMLYAKETISQYALTVAVQRSDWLEGDPSAAEADAFTLEQSLPALAKDLLPAGFRLILEVTVHDFQADLEVQGGGAKTQFASKGTRVLDGVVLDPIPAEKVQAFETLQDRLEEGATGLSLARICDLLDPLNERNAHIRLSLRVFLDKTRLRREVARLAKEASFKAVAFLFPEALLARLQTASLASFEQDYCEPGQRTVILVVGFRGWLSSGVLVVCGPDAGAQLADLVHRPLPAERVEAIHKALAFRQLESSWARPTTWLTPNAFELAASPTVAQGLAADLGRQLGSFQALLSAIFLADSVELQGDAYRIAFRGWGRARFDVSRTALLDQGPACAEALYQLYRYAYDGSSADKLEIAQQFLSLAAKDLPTLCASAVETRDATEATYNKLLKGKVEEYFDARHKVQERVKTAIAETASSVIGLTRELSADLYKIAGVLLAAAVGTFLEPEISAWAFLIAALLIMGYLSLVIFFHLRTMKQTYQLSMGQHRKYIDSLHDVLRDHEIEDALGDEQMGKAEAAFAKKYKQALVLYVLMLIGAALLAYVAFLALLGVFSIVAPPSTATPTSTS